MGVIAAGLAASTPAAAQQDGAAPVYSDVASGVHKPAIEALAERGLFDGTLCGDGAFCPEEPMKRSTMAVWLGRALTGGEPAAIGASRFADVDADDSTAPHIERFADLGVTQGCATDPLRYCPDRAVTRAEMATFLVRAFELDAAGPGGFTDIEGDFHEANINALAAANITAGCATEPLQYCPNQDVTRAEMATFLARALGLIQIPTTTATTGYTDLTVNLGGYVCGLHDDGAIDCWYGAAEISTPSGSYQDVSLSYISGADPYHDEGRECTLNALRSDGTIECWKTRWEGDRPSFVVSGGNEIPEGEYTSMDYGCGIRRDGTAACWDAKWVTDEPQISNVPQGTFKSVSVGAYSACAIRTDGTLVCWAVSEYGSSELRSSAPQGTFKSVDVSHGSACAIGADGTIACWGSFSERPLISNVPEGTFESVAVGSSHACAIGVDGTVACWGDVGIGAGWRSDGSGWSDSIDDAYSGNRPKTFTAIEGTFTAIDIGPTGDCGGGRTYGIRSDGTIVFLGNTESLYCG